MGKIGQRKTADQAVRRTARRDVTARFHGWRWPLHWHLPVVLGLVFFAYSNSFRSGMVFDSASIIGEDPRIREASLHNLLSILTGRYWYVSSTAGLYRPFTTLSYLVNYAILGNGARPEGYHWVNLALHEANVGLVYAVGALIFGESLPAAALAALWGVHPLLTESVTNIVGRADLLAALGVLAGLVCHLKGRGATGRRGLAWFAGLAAAQMIGLFSKENAAVLPGIVLLYELTWRDRRGWPRTVSTCVALVLPFIAFLWLRAGTHGAMQILPAENPLVNAGFWAGRLTAIQVVGRYLCLFLWPAHLSADYSYNAVPVFGSGPWTDDSGAILALAMCGAAVLLAARLAVRWGRGGKPVFFFLLFFFVALSPTSNLFLLIGSIMAERFVYLPAVGLAGCAVALVHALVQRRAPQGNQGGYRLAPAGQFAFALVCLAFAARTYARNIDWRDDLSLWSSAVTACPNAARPHYNLGNALARLPGRLPEAVAEYEAALRIRGDDADAHDNLGTALAHTPGRLAEAITEYQAALRIRPDSADAYDNLGNALAAMGRLPEAIAAYRAALRLRPDRADVHYNLAAALMQTRGGAPDAIREYGEAVRLRPGDADTHLNLGNALSLVPGRSAAAIAEYQAALRLRPGDAQAHYNLGNALAGMPGRLPEAIAEYQAALRIAPDSAEAHNNLGTVLAEMPDRLAEAVAEYQAAVRLKPDFSAAHINLGNALARIPGRLADAVAEYEAAWRIAPDPRLRELITRLRQRRQVGSP